MLYHIRRRRRKHPALCDRGSRPGRSRPSATSAPLPSPPLRTARHIVQLLRSAGLRRVHISTTIYTYNVSDHVYIYITHAVYGIDGSSCIVRSRPGLRGCPAGNLAAKAAYGCLAALLSLSGWHPGCLLHVGLGSPAGQATWLASPPNPRLPGCALLWLVCRPSPPRPSPRRAGCRGLFGWVFRRRGC